MADTAVDKLTRAITKKTIADNRKVVASAGTAEALEDAENVVDFVTLTAETNNTGVMAVGASTVVAALSTRRGTPLFNGESKTLDGVDLNEVYIDATVTGDGVTYEYTK